MRDDQQGEQAAYTIDLDFIDEDEFSLDKLHELFRKVLKPSEQLIYKTLDSGQNAKCLVALCLKLRMWTDEICETTKMAVAALLLEATRIRELHETPPTEEQQDPLIIERYFYVGLAAERKAALNKKCQEKVEILASTADRLSRLLSQLLERQAQQGEAFKTTSLSYLMMSIHLINTEWAKLRLEYAGLTKDQRKLQSIETGVGGVIMQHTDTNTGVVEMREKSWAEIKLIAKTSCLDRRGSPLRGKLLSLKAKMSLVRQGNRSGAAKKHGGSKFQYQVPRSLRSAHTASVPGCLYAKSGRKYQFLHWKTGIVRRGTSWDRSRLLLATTYS